MTKARLVKILKLSVNSQAVESWVNDEILL
jgi:hypothetical protein